MSQIKLWFVLLVSFLILCSLVNAKPFSFFSNFPSNDKDFFYVSLIFEKPSNKLIFSEIWTPSREEVIPVVATWDASTSPPPNVLHAVPWDCDQFWSLNSVHGSDFKLNFINVRPIIPTVLSVINWSRDYAFCNPKINQALFINFLI